MSNGYEQDLTVYIKKYKKYLPLVLAGLIVLVVIADGFFTIQPGEVGIKVRLGKIVDSYSEGLYFKIPFVEKIDRFSIRIQRADIKTSAFSNDMQTIVVDMVVNHRIEKGTVVSIYRNLGPNYVATVIDPITQESVKSITAKYSAEKIISNRADVTQEMAQVVKSRLNEKQIIVTDLSITNFEFTPDFLKSVEDKQIAEQMAKKAEKDVERVKKEAMQVIERARAEAESLKLQREAVSDQLIELRKVEAQIRAIDKWNGTLPQYTGGGAVPFINVK
ncbi:MAG: prohibitin family protein [Bacteroidia bacterium]|nr:prohibitin family protein [Bacteroidia bacterium]